MADLSGFNANEVEPNQPFEVIPARLQVRNYRQRDQEHEGTAKAGISNLSCKSRASEFVNRKLFDRLNIWNANEKRWRLPKARQRHLPRRWRPHSPRLRRSAYETAARQRQRQ